MSPSSFPLIIARRLGERHRLTAAETAVLAGLIAGQPPAELAQTRACSPATVRVHIRALHAKLNISRSMALLPLVVAELEGMNLLNACVSPQPASSAA